MVNGIGRKASELKHQGDRLGAKAMHHPGTEKLARLGYLAKGVVYAVVGVLALQVAFGSGGKTTDTKGALSTLAQGSWSKALLVDPEAALASLALRPALAALLLEGSRRRETASFAASYEAPEETAANGVVRASGRATRDGSWRGARARSRR